MRFVVITHSVHTYFEGNFYSYGPYVREMRLWEKNVTQLIVVAPLTQKSPSAIDLHYLHQNIKFIPIPDFNILGIRGLVRSFFLLPLILFKIGYGMFLSDHIHLRCPGNVGLLGCFVQLFFPFKKKTAKYAGNWDEKSLQPWSYRLQKFFLKSELLTKNIKVLVYGDWPSKTKNILPFFTASYFESDKVSFVKPNICEKIRLIFVGGLYPNKNPKIAIEVCNLLKSNNRNVELVVCGDGPEHSFLFNLCNLLNLNNEVTFLGNVSAESVKKKFMESHFLIFVSDSEGWPKVVAEAMWWGCIPITTPVSCVPQMLGNGERGFLTEKNSFKIYNLIEESLNNLDHLSIMSNNGLEWARKFTLEKFEDEIKDLI